MLHYEENFIDAIIEAAGEKASAVAEEIARTREDKNLPPNVEYDRHLRLVLSALAPQRVVIILDEIDSLISVPYSDVVFAQIRRMYFSRMNYPVYERLTYVLSGVAEPTDLIKDKNISPFNIGEKIYLDDFSRQEFGLFLERAGLDFAPDVSEEIYEWTTGNPRMTWDVCSELENSLIAGIAPKREDVAAAVQKIYLDRFDRPPVDHIRSLAESDPDVHNAIISIRWGKGDTLTERVKSKLYLAGISGISASAPKIKNKIVDLALSESWLSQIAKHQKGYLEIAAEAFASGNFADTIRLITAYETSEAGAREGIPATALYQLGVAKQSLGDSVGAIAPLKKALAGDSLNEEMRRHASFSLSSALVITGSYEESIPLYEEVLTHSSKLKLPAMLGYGAALLQINVKRHFDKAIGLFNGVLNEAAETPNEALSNLQEVRASAYFSLAQAYSAMGETARALGYLDNAIAAAPKTMLPQLYISRGALGARRDLLGWIMKATRVVEDEHLGFVDAPGSVLQFSEKILAVLLSTLELLGQTDAFGRLLDYVKDNLYSAPQQPLELLVHLYRRAKSSEEALGLSNLLEAGLARFADHVVSPAKYEEAVRAYALSAPSAKKGEAFRRYLARIPQRAQAGLPFAEEDLVALFNASRHEQRNRNYRGMLEAVAAASIAMPRIPAVEDFSKVLFLSQEMFARQALGDHLGARKTAQETIALVESLKPSPDIVEAVNGFREAAANYLKSNAADPFKGFGRNKKVIVREPNSGAIYARKFKFVERELRSGKLILQSIEDGTGSKN